MIVNFQKIIAFITSVSLCFVVCSFPVFAETGAGTGGNRDQQFTSYTTRYLTDVFEILKNSLQNGDITADDGLKVANLTKNYMDNTVKYAVEPTLNELRNSLQTVSDTFSRMPDDIGSDLRTVANGFVQVGRDLLDFCGIDYGKTEVTENVVDMRGAPCSLKFNVDSNGYSRNSIIYCSYGRITPLSNGQFDLFCYMTGVYYGSSGTYDVIPWEDYSFSFTFSDFSLYTFYGDWVYADGTPATDVTTPHQNIIYTNDPSSLTDTQLIDLLEDLLLNLKLDFPDLSSVEGLLSAILTKLGTLDSDNDNGLLSDIYVAIQSLKTDSHPESQQIIVLLEEIRDNLTGTSSGSGETSDLTELTEILKDMKKSLNYLVGLETVDVAADIIDLANIEFSELDNKFFNKYASLINTVINKFGYGPVDAMLKTCQAIVFNTSAPSDLSINYNGNDYTILSTSMFENEDVKKSLDLVKTFISIFILIGWLTIMRKRITSTE